LLIAGDLANGLFHSALDLFASALNSILVHRSPLLIFRLFIATRMRQGMKYHSVELRSVQNCSLHLNATSAKGSN
jgi:hypothetical protein